MYNYNTFWPSVVTKAFPGPQRKWGVSQPAVSNAIHALEDEGETFLFERDRKRLTLTPKGESLKLQAQELLGRFHRVEEMLADSSQRQPELRIGVTPMGTSHHFPYYLYYFRQQYPNVTIQVFERSNPSLLRMLSNGELHLALVSNPAPKEEGFDSHKLLEDQITIAIHHNHPFASCRELGPNELKQLPFVLFPYGYSQHQRYHKMMEGYGLTPQVLVYTEHVNTIYSFLSAGIAAGYMFASNAVNFPHLKCFPVTQSPFVSVYLAWSENYYLPVAAKAFIDLCTG